MIQSAARGTQVGKGRGTAIMAGLKRVHDRARASELPRFVAFKRISLDKVSSEIGIAGDFAEFGVWKGQCARWILEFLPVHAKLHLFDSFEGLPEDWVGQFSKGHFALDEHQIPHFDDTRVRVIKGLFSKTLPGYFHRDRPLSFIHMDADLYSSTMDVLCNVNHVIVPGTVILFDEYVLLKKGQTADDEYRALMDYCAEYRRQFAYLWRTNHSQVAIRITL
jgi:hypothetical protein